MVNEYSVADLLDFLSHAGERGLMPAATAQALAVAVRNVFGVLDSGEQEDLRELDLDAIINRFTNKRARDFNPTSLKEYARRVRRAVELYTKWRANPADFSIKTRTPGSGKKTREGKKEHVEPVTPANRSSASAKTDALVSVQSAPGGYQSAFPVRPGRVVTLLNVPEDLTSAEADRLAQFVRMLAVQ